MHWEEMIWLKIWREVEAHQINPKSKVDAAIAKFTIFAAPS